MKSIANKIILLTSIFLILTIGIVAFVYSQAERNEFVCATEIPQPICGNTFSEKAQEGKNLFNANCAACHKLYKKMVGPSLKGLVQNNRYPSSEYFYEYVRNENELIKNNDEYAKAINAEYSRDYSHEFKLTDLEVEQILEYISE